MIHTFNKLKNTNEPHNGNTVNISVKIDRAVKPNSSKVRAKEIKNLPPNIQNINVPSDQSHNLVPANDKEITQFRTNTTPISERLIHENLLVDKNYNNLTKMSMNIQSKTSIKKYSHQENTNDIIERGNSKLQLTFRIFVLLPLFCVSFLTGG